MKGPVFALIAALVLTGCASVPPATDEDPGERPTSGERVPVVAILDTGINPYHAAFAAGPIPAEVPAPYRLVELASAGTLDERIGADEQFWSSVERGELYRFAGTRLLGISFGGRPGEPLIDSIGHGTEVASVVTSTAPDALVVVVQVNDLLCDVTDPAAYCPVYINLADAMEWVANQSWIDVVSISISLTGNPPADEKSQQEHVVRFLAAQERAHDAGMFVVNGAGNVVTPPFASYLGGPPCVVAVGGVDPVRHGDSPESGRGVDVAANYTANVADAKSLDAWEQSSGTSYGTPLVAAVLAGAIVDLQRNATLPRVQLRHEVREALNRTATVLGVEDWNPLDDPLANPTVTPGVPVVAPGPQTGWGVVNATHRAMIVNEVHTPAAPAKPAHLVTYMGAWADAREAYWA